MEIEIVAVVSDSFADNNVPCEETEIVAVLSINLLDFNTPLDVTPIVAIVSRNYILSSTPRLPYGVSPSRESPNMIVLCHCYGDGADSKTGCWIAKSNTDRSRKCFCNIERSRRRGRKQAIAGNVAPIGRWNGKLNYHGVGIRPAAAAWTRPTGIARPTQDSLVTPPGNFGSSRTILSRHDGEQSDINSRWFRPRCSTKQVVANEFFKSIC